MATESYDTDLENMNGSQSEEAREEMEPEGEEEEDTEAVPLSPSILAEGLSLINKVSDGFAHAYVRLSLRERSLNNLEGIQGFIHLRFVDISNNYIKSLQPLENLTTLLVLNCDNNKITSIDLPPLQFLQILSLSGNKIKSTEGLNFPLLEQLILNDNDITEIRGLDPTIFSSLHSLELRGNKIASTRGIHLPNLRSLYLAANGLTDLTDVDCLSSLQTLHLRDNSQLSNLNGLSGSLSSLHTLNLRSTDVSTFAEIVKLEQLGALKKLTLSETPIASESTYRAEVLSYIKSLATLDKDNITEDEVLEAQEIRNLRMEEDALSETEPPKDIEA